MKLYQFQEIKEIRKKAGIPEGKFTGEKFWNGIDEKEILKRIRSREGYEGKINEIEFDKNTGVAKHFTKEVVLIYIRDQIQREDGKGSNYKFHFSKCKTLSGFIRAGKYDRYVYTSNRDGTFKINTKFNDEIIEKGKIVKMQPCLWCLAETNFLDCKEDWNKKRTLETKFPFKKFFEIYQIQNVEKPTHNENTAPINFLYSADFQKTISPKYKESKNWICEKCGLDCKERKEFLHTHHIDHKPSNNNPNNLKALCICCHAEEFGAGHKNLKSQSNYILCQKYKNKVPHV